MGRSGRLLADKAVAIAAAVAISATLLFSALGTGAAAASATLTLSPASGLAGSAVTATGTAFPVKVTTTVKFNGAKVASAKTSSTGGFTVRFAIPKVAPGSYPVVASTNTVSAAATFTVTTTTPNAATTSSSSTSSTSTTVTTVPPASSFVGRSGRTLTLNGAPYRFTGLNAYQLTTDYTVNFGCGENNSQTDLDSFFSSLRPNSVVRFWALEQLAWDKNTNSMAFTTFDHVVHSAEQHGQKLIPVIGNQWAGCGETYKDRSWFVGGYRQVINDGTANGQLTNTLSYWDFLDRLVARYANSPAIAFWEPLNEPTVHDVKDGPCSSDAASVLRSFYDTVGAEIKRVDPHHLVSSGVEGNGQCGAVNGDYQTLHQSAAIDVATYHDYDQPTAAMPGDQWNGLQVRLNQMAAINKPIFIEESGINASDTSGSITLAQRRDDFANKMNAEFQAGIVGYVPWMWSRTVSGADYHIAPGDPTLTLLHDYTL